MSQLDEEHATPCIPVDFSIPVPVTMTPPVSPRGTENKKKQAANKRKCNLGLDFARLQYLVVFEGIRK